MSVMGEAEEEACAVYDVFINHRGLDTKKTLASLIYRGLIKYGLRVFLDRDELEAGDTLNDKISSSINSASVHVAIFSKRYAESFWCLNELLEMLQSRSHDRCEIIPIFYGVKPADLRHIDKGCYADAFRDHQNKRRHDVELVERWKDALQKTSNISGEEFNTEEDDLGVLVEDIVEKVLKKAKWKILYVAEYPVGLHQAVEDFNIFLKEKQLSGTTVVGIIGPDGSGKSTLVKQLYNCYFQSVKFERCCFLAELNYEKDLVVLQQKLVRDLLGHDKYSISDTTEGKGMLQTCLKGCGPVLIVLDGLDKKEQIESLLVGKKHVLAEGSLILVTCHDESLLREHKLNEFYHVKYLQGKDARDLFCWYAFDPPKAHKHLEDPPTPPEHLEDLVEKFVDICCGFPLALEVLGRKLYVKQDRKCWEEQLKELSRPKIPKEIVDKILKVTYDDLEEEKKEVFLDVAHFLVGEDTDLAVRVLGGLHGTSALLCLQEFQRKCLLDLEKIEHFKRPFAKGAGIQWRTKGSSKIRMHDLVRKMATQIASEDSCSSPETKTLRLVEQVGNECIFEQLDNKSILQEEFPFGVSTVILGGANVLRRMYTEKVDSVKQSILKEFQGATIIDFPIIGNEQRVQLRNMELYEAIFLCFIAKRNSGYFDVSVGDNVYFVDRPHQTMVELEEAPWLYTFMWSQNSNLFKDLKFHGKRVLDCTIKCSGTSNVSLTEACIVMIRNSTDGAKICKWLFNSLCCIPK